MFLLHFSVFHPILKKRCFWTSFGSLLASIFASFWLPGVPRGSPWHPKGRFGDLFLNTCFSYSFLMDSGCPPGPLPPPVRIVVGSSAAGVFGSLGCQLGFPPARERIFRISRHLSLVKEVTSVTSFWHLPLCDRCRNIRRRFPEISGKGNRCFYKPHASRA